LVQGVNSQENLTKTGVVIGTPAYMSPEQILNSKEVTLASDVFSLGTIFYEMLTGVKAFQGSDTFKVLRAVVEPKPLDLSLLQNQLSTYLFSLLEGMLQKTIHRRVANGMDINSLLQSKTIRKENTSSNTLFFGDFDLGLSVDKEE
jgi:eukaryotic-like serine/threonine-protein kinase